ncbi:MAG: cytochrome c biogenesis protein CcsA [Armatimonas sp.]
MLISYTGYGLLILSLIATVAANVLFPLSTRAGQEKLLPWAKKLAYLSTGAILAAAAYLMYLITTHQFQIAYVAEYSAKRSDSWYLLAAFWGGQEGSILLWAFWSTLLAAVMVKKGGKSLTFTWTLYGIVQIYLLFLLLLKCPFKLGTGPVPADGRGLNPLLENYWMVIHPPMLFLGWSSTVFPAIFGIYGLLKRDWDGWAKQAFSWSLFSFATLGFGLSLGGYWAYETLGWGGFWAWDPVENSSLVPWLLLVALLHGIPVQLKNGGMRIGNFLLAFLPFAAMNYGTFLTRTGLLSDFSVHSFSSLGNQGKTLMMVAVLILTFVPMGLLFWRWREIPKGGSYDKILSREFGFFLAALIFGLLGVLVTIGMSAPILSKYAPFQFLLKGSFDLKAGEVFDPKKGAAVGASFYDQAAYPMAILFTLLMAATPYLAWKNNVFESMGKKLFPSYIAAIGVTLVMTALGFYLGVRKPWMVLLFATSMFAALANVLLILPRLKHPKPRMTIGGFVAHAGAGLALAGIACLVAFQKTVENVELHINQPVQVKELGYTLTYLGYTTQPFDRGSDWLGRDGNHIRIRVEKNGHAWEARPRFYFAPWNNKDEMFGNPPSIHRPNLLTFQGWMHDLWQGDLYVAHAGEPVEQMDDPRALSSNNQFSLENGKSKTFGEYTFTLMNEKLDDASAAALRAANEAAFNSLPQTRVSAIVNVKWRDKEVMVEPTIVQKRNAGMFSEVATIPGPEGKPVILRFVPPPSQQEVGEAMAGSRAAVEEAKKAGPPGSPAFREALTQSPAFFEAQQIQSLSEFKTLRFETFNAPDPSDLVYVSIGTKPMIWMVWLGTLLFSAGGFVAYRRRAKEQGIFGDDGDDNLAANKVA